jgi:glycosyltransferase involved in cell wall biosynthesis
MVDISVVAPVYNEAASLRKTLLKWIQTLTEVNLNAELILIFDGCSDSSFSVAENALASCGLPVILIDEPINSGAGVALSKGMRVASGKFILLVDSDGQFELFDGLKLYTRICELEGAVAGVGVRGSKGSFLMPQLWKLSSFFFRWRTGVSLQDPSCALKVFSRSSTSPSIELQTRWNYSLEMTLELHCRNYQFVEMGVNYRDRIAGKSNFHVLRDGLRRLKFLSNLRGRDEKHNSL